MVSLVIILCLIASYSTVIIIPDHVEAATTPIPEYLNGQKNTCKYNPNPDVDGPIPVEISPCNSNNFKFNSKFYHQSWAVYSASNGSTPVSNTGQMKFIIYGNPKSVPSNAQSFSKGWQPGDYSTVRKNEGHFYGEDADTGNMAWGEYRFLGYTQDGSLYSNNWLVRDDSTSTKLVDKHWIYQPWENLPLSYKYKPESPGYVYRNKQLGQLESVMLDKFLQIRNNINRSIDFQIYKGVSYSNRYEVLPRNESNNDPRNYFAIEQNPTTREAGVGRLFHFSWDTDSVWYQSFPMEKLDPLEKLPSAAACKVESLNGEPIPLGKERTVKVQVKITGTLDDTTKIGDLQYETIYYTRKDIAFWHLSVMDQNGQELKLSSSNKNSGVVTKDNAASGIVTMTIDTDKLIKTNPDEWVYGTNNDKELNAKAAVYYNNHTSANPSSAEKGCHFNLKFKPTTGPMLSDFSVAPQIQFVNKSAFLQSQIMYKDMSYGKDVDYYTFEVKNIEDGTKVTRTFNPAIPEVKSPNSGYLDQTAVTKFLYDFIAAKFPNEVVDEAPVYRSFQITQTIIDKDQTVNNSSFAVKNINVSQLPASNPIIIGCPAMSPETDTGPDPPQYIMPNVEFAFDWYDVVPMPVTEKEPDYIPHKPCDEAAKYADFTKRVFVAGAEVDSKAFFRGEYVFGEEQIGLVKVDITFTAPDGTESIFSRHVVVHETKPRVSIALEGLFKENRTMQAFDRSKESNDQWTEKQAPLTITSFSFVDASDPNLKCRTGYCENNLSEKMYMYKSIGNYQLSIAAKRVIVHNGKTYTRNSDPYIVDYEILEDHKPAIIAHAYGDQISRLEQLQLNYEVESTDGDYIAEKKLQVFYDSKNQGVFDTKVFESTGEVAELPKLDKLGQYEIVVETKEGTNEERLTEFITAADDKANTSRTHFFIDNYAPASDLYIDVPTEKPDMDIFFLLDKNLAQASTDYVKNQKVAITNAFTLSNMMSNIGIWDMKTYTYNQPASTSKATGTAYPPTTLSYTTSGGYSGTLSRTSVSNNPYTQDDGKYVTVVDSTTGTYICRNTVTTTFDDAGQVVSQSDTSTCNGSYVISSGNYSGTVYKTSANPQGPSCAGTISGSCSRDWEANYSGTLYWSHEVWEPKMVEYNSYTGFYSGTVYKDIRQPYDASFLRAVPSKYVIYISDGKVSEQSDLQYVMSKQNAKLILVGNNDIAAQIPHEKHILHNKPIDQIIEDVIAYIADHNPQIPKVLKLLGEPIETVTATFDYEDDPTPADTDLLQITQDPNYYDNAMGYDSFAGQSLISAKLGSNWRLYQSQVTFQKPGKYVFYRKIKDLPTTDPNFSGYAYNSNESAIEVYVHRKPIAEVTLDFDYLSASNTYRTIWIDMSYDLDHNVTRAASDRGIQDRTIRFANQETGEVFTKIPNELLPGTYVLDYVAQDIEGVWCDPIQRTFVLPSTVPVQFKSKLKTAYSGFSLASIPASEGLVAYDLWTRYPYSISLAMSMGTQLSRNVAYYTGTKLANDISWANESFTIPATMPDGNYSFVIRANGSVAGSTAAHTYSVRVWTPIDLTGRLDAVTGEPAANDVSTLVVKDTYQLLASTTKYPTATTVIAFKGTSYQKTVTLSPFTTSTLGYGQKNWSGSLTVGTMPSGSYTFEWRSTTPNGNVETVMKTVQVVNNRPPTADFDWLPKPVYEGDTVQFKSIIADADGDSLAVSYELVSPRGTKTNYSYTLTSPYPATAPLIRMVDPGSWTVTMTVSDGKAPPVVTVKTVTVLPLTVSGLVKHTDLWNEHRRKFNEKKSGEPESPRGYNLFWAGEKFLLESVTTVTGTATKADRVEVKMGETVLTLAKTNGSGTSWGGELWKEEFAQLDDGPLTFTFTASYNNGTTKSITVTVIIEGDTIKIVGVHRVQ
ncbi:Athe_2463 domain-containing protein [Paenibacillus sp. YIM B09110]|uniref:Athe_2463 domain-containing protein n=1 Tax=Paenibacillus sp. YIM B09110 TaxID=3126102 RepID=UPI003FA68BC6